jgi:hypothetical protein
LQIKRLHQSLRVTALLAVVTVALLLSGCSLSQRGSIQKNVSQDDLSAGNEPYFDVGDLTFQIQDSRQLNPFSDDVEYFAGLPQAQKLPGSDFWYGVFIWAKNQQTRTLTSPGQYDFTLTDSAGDTYKPTMLDPNLNPFAWTSQTIQPDGIEPNPDSIAAGGTTAGGLILFQLPQTAYQNRPLTLHISPYGKGSKHVASAVSLDL